MNKSTNLSTEKFLKLSKQKVAEELNIFLDTDTYNEENIFMVWYSKSLQNHKGLFSAPGEHHIYFEITYDGDNKKFYIDMYNKAQNTICDLYDDKLKDIETIIYLKMHNED